MGLGSKLGYVGIGFLVGTVGVKALQSKQAHDAAVKVVAAGMTIQDAYQDVVEEAKAQVDDIVAEATYVKDQGDVVEVEAEAENE